ncbi:MAG TPA: PEP-CTERM sorting domain-containing protein [Phycisphaerae bacterium]|nr:PEP-CTERM sorting domain-containing protein [Phycisphaerae bacterium]
MFAGNSYRKALFTVLGLALVSLMATSAYARANGGYIDVTKHGETAASVYNGTANTTVAVTNLTDTVTLDVWATIVGTTPQITGFSAAFYSSADAALPSWDPGTGVITPVNNNAGLLKANLSLTYAADDYLSATRDVGTSQDLDGDGDLDLGRNSSIGTADFVNNAAGSPLGAGPAPNIFDPMHIGTLTVTGIGVGNNKHGVTKIFAWGKPGMDSHWYIDGTPYDQQISTGLIVTIYQTATAVVGPTLTLGEATPSGLLGGTGSTGTIGTWEWIIGGITTGLTGDFPNVSWEYCVDTLGLAPDATYGVTLNLGSAYETGITPGTGFITLELTPEPATLALMAFGALAMLSRRRRSA